MNELLTKLNRSFEVLHAFESTFKDKFFAADKRFAARPIKWRA
jgi:hypothetical protein